MNSYVVARLRGVLVCLSLVGSLALAQEPAAVAPFPVRAEATVAPAKPLADPSPPADIPAASSAIPQPGDAPAAVVEEVPAPAAPSVVAPPVKPRRIVKPISPPRPVAQPATDATPAASDVPNAPSQAAATPPTKPPVQPTASALPSRNLAGKVNLVDGVAHVYSPDHSAHVPKIGDSVYEGDAIATGDDAELHIDMADGGFIAVRPNTTVRFTKYQANGDADDRSVIGLLKGSLRSITGWIGKAYPEHYAIKTPGATIGVRGTDHEPAYYPEASGDVAAGTYDTVHAGGTTMSTVSGKVDVAPDHAGYVGSGAHDAPKVLNEVPAFFSRPRRNDAVFEGKHDQIVASYEAKRLQRQAQHQQEVSARAAARNVRGDASTSGPGEHSGSRRELERRAPNTHPATSGAQRSLNEHPDGAQRHESDQHQGKKEEKPVRRTARHWKER